jgi:hypothetical protein
MSTRRKRKQAGDLFHVVSGPGSALGDKIDRDADRVRAQSGAQLPFGSITVPVSARFKKHGEMSEWLKEHAWKLL